MTVVLSEAAGSSPVVAQATGSEWRLVSAVTFSSTYATGGEPGLKTAINAILGQVGTGVIDFAIVTGYKTHYPIWDPIAEKLLFIVASTGVELAAAEYPAALLVAKQGRLMAVGR